MELFFFACLASYMRDQPFFFPELRFWGNFLIYYIEGSFIHGRNIETFTNWLHNLPSCIFTRAGNFQPEFFSRLWHSITETTFTSSGAVNPLFLVFLMPSLDFDRETPLKSTLSSKFTSSDMMFHCWVALINHKMINHTDDHFLLQ